MAAAPSLGHNLLLQVAAPCPAFPLPTGVPPTLGGPSPGSDTGFTSWEAFLTVSSQEDFPFTLALPLGPAARSAHWLTFSSIQQTFAGHLLWALRWGAGKQTDMELMVGGKLS